MLACVPVCASFLFCLGALAAARIFKVQRESGILRIDNFTLHTTPAVILYTMSIIPCSYSIREDISRRANLARPLRDSLRPLESTRP